MVSVAPCCRSIAKAVGIGAISHTGIGPGCSVSEAVCVGRRAVTVTPGSRCVAETIGTGIVGHAIVCAGGRIAEAVSVGC